MTAAPAQPSLEQLSGLVERVTFHNADSGFCVLLDHCRSPAAGALLHQAVKGGLEW